MTIEEFLVLSVNHPALAAPPDAKSKKQTRKARPKSTPATKKPMGKFRGSPIVDWIWIKPPAGYKPGDQVYAVKMGEKRMLFHEKREVASIEISDVIEAKPRSTSPDRRTAK